MSELQASGLGEHPPPYMIFLVVFLFFLTGLLGFLICHLLKKKGYRCRTGDMEEDEEEEKAGGNAEDEDEENQDTVEQILKCIIENEANMEAFNEMLGNHNVCVRHDPRLRKESVSGVPPHLHTVHSGSDHNSCHLCAQVRSKKGRRHSRTPRSKHRPGEQTVFSVGRFRVTHTDKKLHGGPNPSVGSGDQLDQSQDSEEQKGSGYNLRNMFKDVRPPPEGVNGVAPTAGKRRKSLTLFGLRRGSDPVAFRGVEGAGREGAGVRFAIQQQPVVLEEVVQAETGTKPAPEPLQDPTPESNRAGSVLSSQSKKQAHESGSDPGDGSARRSGPEPCTVAASVVPSSLPIPSPASSRQATETRGHVEDRGLNDPGPVQTSTPIAPPPGSLPGFSSVVLTAQPGPGAAFPVFQTPSVLTSSPEPEPGLGTSPAVISLGSSPPSSSLVQFPSSASSLKTPTSPQVLGPTPSLTASPPAPTSRQSPASSKTVSPLQARASSPPGADQNPSFGTSPRLTPKSGSVSGGDSSPLPPKTQEQEVARIPQTGVKRPGILKPARTSGSVPSSPPNPLSEDRLSGLPLSPSSPAGGGITSVAVVKAGPDSKREFSVTAAEDARSVRDRGGETSGPESVGKSPAVGPGGRMSVSGEDLGGETSVVRRALSRENDDTMEMEDIRDCKVTQEAQEEHEEEVPRGEP